MTSRTKIILQAISFSGLALSTISPILVFTEVLSKDMYLNLMIAGMLMWFGSAIFWIKKDHLN